MFDLLEEKRQKVSFPGLTIIPLLVGQQWPVMEARLENLIDQGHLSLWKSIAGIENSLTSKVVPAGAEAMQTRARSAIFVGTVFGTSQSVGVFWAQAGCCIGPCCKSHHMQSHP